MVQRGGDVSFVIYVSSHFRLTSRENKEQRPVPGWGNLHVGAVSRHKLDSLNTSNELLKNKNKMPFERYPSYLREI